MSDKDLSSQYPWLSITTTIEEYVSPEYYDNLLKDYIFNNKIDLEFFSDFLSHISTKGDPKILELGCGSGRATNVLFSWLGEKDPNCVLVDLSKQMIDFSRNRFSNRKDLRFINSDSVNFLEKTKGEYDIVFSLWSFSHSVHQILSTQGLEKGRQYVVSVLKKMFTDNIKTGGSFFLIHFDSLSEEQKILIQQWKKVLPIFKDSDMQSPSKCIIDEIMTQLQEDGIISFKCNHYVGKEIVYSSENEALEVFMNFHMESYFNEMETLPNVIDELKSYFRKYTDSSGAIKIKPGCFIYEAKKIK